MWVVFLLLLLLHTLSLSVHAEDLGDLPANEFDQNSIADPFDAENPDDPNSITNEFELGPYGNPYSPSSATNFEGINAPRLYDQEGNDHGRLSVKAYDREWVSNPYGRCGSPYSPDSFNNRFGAGNPYRPSSPTNPYGHGLRIEGR
jgi:hypothetical protein